MIPLLYLFIYFLPKLEFLSEIICDVVSKVRLGLSIRSLFGRSGLLKIGISSSSIMEI